MTYRTIAAFLMMSTAAAVVHPQGIYRSVAPDGTVSYSDQPVSGAAKGSPAGRSAPSSGPAPGAGSSAAPAPAGSNAPAPVGSGSGAPVGTNAARAAPSAADATATLPASRAVSKQAVERVQPIDDASTRAMVSALGRVVLVQRTEALCGQTSPDAHRRYSAIADAWRKRNDNAIEHARRALNGGFTSEQRRTIELDLRIKADSGLTRVSSAQTAQRIAWCERSFDELSKGALDIKASPVAATSPAVGAAALADARSR